jgi:branched-chain amino acid transport system substrate-binding protein
MTNPKNETTVLIVSLLVTGALLAGGFWLFTNRFGGDVAGILGNNGQTTGSNTPSSRQLQNRISQGERILITADTTPQKQAGVQAFANGNYGEAANQFQSSLSAKRNDPETLIYFNNAKAASGNPLKVAVSVPIGSNLNIAQEILRGVAQAQDEVNQAGGINGRLLSVAIANDDNNPQLSKQLAQAFVQDSDLLAVVGHNSSNATLAAASVYEQGELVMISPSSDARTISESGDYIFRTIPSIRFQADTLSRYVVNTARRRNIAICNDSQAEYSQSLKQEFTFAIVANGGRVAQLDCDFSAANFNASTILSQASSAGADGLLLIPSVDRLNPAINLARANQGRNLLLGSATLYTFQTLQQGQESVNDMVLAVPWHPEAFTGNAFPQRATQLWGGQVNWRTALGYDAMQSIIAGLRQGNTTRQGLQQELSRPGFSTTGATGTIQFLPSGDRDGAAILVQVQPGGKSNTGFDFVPLQR